MNLFERCIRKYRFLLQGRLRCSDLVASYVDEKIGIEIGGPSLVFQKAEGLLNIYPKIRRLDNCDFSDQTTWANHADKFQFDADKAPGRSIFCEGSDLSSLPDESYDFVLSSHNLEHFANPVKALKGWQRISKKHGALVLVLPNYRRTFDHFRKPTPVSHMLEDYARETGEDDLTHLPEILEKHDLSMDPLAGSPEQFRERSLANYTNRCLHHHVFDENNSRELLTSLGMKVLAVETAEPFHIFLLAEMSSS